MWHCARVRGEPAGRLTRKKLSRNQRPLEHNGEVGGNSLDAVIVQEDSWAAAIALGLPPVPPPARLRKRLLARVGEFDTPKQPYGVGDAEADTIRSDEGKWLPVCAGVRRKQLYYDAQRNTSTFLLRLDPGATLPAHSHGGTEQCLVLEGEVEDGSVTLRTGDFQTLKPGSVHPASRSVRGCLLLIVAAEPAATNFV